VTRLWDYVAALLAAAADAERCDAEALRVGVRRVHRQELAAAFNRGRLQGMRDCYRHIREEHFEDVAWDAPSPLDEWGAGG
jgi:hypothetical protein